MENFNENLNLPEVKLDQAEQPLDKNKEEMEEIAQMNREKWVKIIKAGEADAYTELNDFTSKLIKEFGSETNKCRMFHILGGSSAPIEEYDFLDFTGEFSIIEYLDGMYRKYCE